MDEMIGRVFWIPLICVRAGSTSMMHFTMSIMLWCVAIDWFPYISVVSDLIKNHIGEKNEVLQGVDDFGT